jgi:hypothetical protein
LLQYVDDILIATDSLSECRQGTEDLLVILGDLGYRVSTKKSQICKKEVIYLGYILKDGQRWLREARKETVLKIPTPTTRRAV